MAEALEDGKCVDVNTIGVPFAGFEGVVWELKRGAFREGMDYCDAIGEQWIWSIGQRVTDGRVFASADNRFHQNEMFKCLWLR